MNNAIVALKYFHTASGQWTGLENLVSIVKLHVDMLNKATIDLTGYNRWTRNQLLHLKKKLQEAGVATNQVKIYHQHLASFSLLWDQL